MPETLNTIEEPIAGAISGEDYDAEKFKKLSDRDHVRLRYGMYIGDSSVQGLHHLVYELVNNSIDEVMGGYAQNIWVTINNDGSCTVEDDGRGIPVERHEQTSAEKGRDVPTLDVEGEAVPRGSVWSTVTGAEATWVGSKADVALMVTVCGVLVFC